jgi:hypothetical protein
MELQHPIQVFHRGVTPSLLRLPGCGLEPTKANRRSREYQAYPNRVLCFGLGLGVVQCGFQTIALEFTGIARASKARASDCRADGTRKSGGKARQV